MVIIEAVNNTSLDKVADLALKLWPDNDWSNLKDEFEELLQSNNDTVYLAVVEGEYVGFIHMSLRYDYVEGSNSSPVGYVEGIYVEEEHRNKGISKQLVAAGEEWSKSLGCKEIASDTQLENHASQEFHRKIGFKEAGRIVAFIKRFDE
ncbi:aminoglycoside 6'-N-acetyltransferase [Cohnella sp. JJ-181]|uniref:aminoglycoside 6'-N-acetyltransferase n=1 Tax=Cohnella rhizoplanae TaxID=2974897 RepID=UPI0022FF6E85|nr:aminoglycoside 6'-N-acetyltransferase [Cohnella sp. JJ-181]CAI6087333.1 Aminoglycoside N(6')-acetyltransferase type 1 [Cohnella sp. JJ-181]